MNAMLVFKLVLIAFLYSLVWSVTDVVTANDALGEPFTLNKQVSSILTKTSFSMKTRLIFVAGLEGTGHHAMFDMFSVCSISLKCEPDVIIGAACMRFDSNKNTNVGLFGSGASTDAVSEISIIENRMKELLKLPGDHLYYIGLKAHKTGGMMSYPNFNGKDKALDNPDVYALALIAESVGLDFRILVLQRDAENIIRSTTSRGFGGSAGLENEPKILLSSANALYGQLSSLDRRFFECIRYDQLGNLSEESAKQLIEFLHPANMKGELREMLKKVKYANSSSNNEIRSNDVTASSGGFRQLNVPPQMKEKLASLRAKADKRPRTGSASAVSNEGNSPSRSQSMKYHTMLLAQRLSLIDGLCAAV